MERATSARSRPPILDIRLRREKVRQAAWNVMQCRAVGGKCQVARLIMRCSSGAVMAGDDQDDQEGSPSRTTCRLHVDMRNGRLEWRAKEERGRWTKVER
jgi:hypothetical protein